MRFHAKLIVTLLLLVQIVVVFSGETPKWFSDLVYNCRNAHDLIVDDEIVSELYQTITSVALKYDLDPLLITAMIKVETEFRNVIGIAGELGMMQIKKETAQLVARKFGLKEPDDGWLTLLWDYRLNIEYGALYLKYLLEKSGGNVVKALEWYNGGSFKTEYARSVMSSYKELISNTTANRGG